MSNPRTNEVTYNYRTARICACAAVSLPMLPLKNVGKKPPANSEPTSQQGREKGTQQMGALFFRLRFKKGTGQSVVGHTTDKGGKRKHQPNCRLEGEKNTKRSEVCLMGH